MKRMIIVLLLGAGLFGASAGVSLYLQQRQHSTGADGEGSEKGKGAGKSGAPAAEAKGPALPSRALAKPSAESLAQLAASLKQKEDALLAKEQKLATRQGQLDLIFGELAAEQKALEATRQEIAAEMKTLAQKMDELEQKARDVEKKKLALSDTAREVKDRMTELDGVEQRRIKEMSEYFNTMAADKVAESFQHMVDSGKMDTAVKILSHMQPKQVAKVLPEIDAATAVLILEKLRTLKKPANPGG